MSDESNYDLPSGHANVRAKNRPKEDNEPPLSIFERVCAPFLKRMPTRWLVRVLRNRYEVHIMFLMKSREERIKGGKADGSVTFDMNGQCYWAGNRTQLAALLLKFSEEIDSGFPQSDVPDTLDYGGVMGKEE